MQIKTADGNYNVASNGLGVWGAVGGGLGTLALANQVLGGSGGLLGLNGTNQQIQCQDTRQISALQSDLAKEKAERYADQVAIASFKESQIANDKLAVRISTLEAFAHETDKKNAVLEAVLAERLNCISNRVTALEGLTKLVVPNTSVCPGWGNVTITPATTTAG